MNDERATVAENRAAPATGSSDGADREGMGDTLMTLFPIRQASPTASRLRLRELLAGPVPVELPGPYDATSAQLLARIGFGALWGGGYVGGASRMGVADVNLMTMTEQVDFCRSLVDATGLPVVADADNGYGEALQVGRAVQLFERAGVAGLVIEDQASPKHCAFYTRLPLNLVSKDEIVAKIKTAVDARTDESMMIWARTDALPAGKGTAEALDRAAACVEAGADAVFTPSASLEDLAEIAGAWGRPEPLCMSSFNFPELTNDRVKEIGYKLRLHPLPAILAALRAVELVFTELHRTGSFGSATAGSMPSAEFEELIGAPLAETLDEGYRAMTQGNPAAV
jgi:2-methylisocitrate lyase-like PEP mutase family enzyme